MELFNGRKLSQKNLDEIRGEISKTVTKLRLAAVVVGEDPVIRKFVEQKKRPPSRLELTFAYILFRRNG